MKFGVGQPVRRFEDQTLITGTGRYTDDINLPGEPRTGRLQFRIEVRSVWRSGGRARVEESGADLFLPTFEVVDNASGRTTLQGGLVKLGSGRLVLQADGTY